MILPTKVIKPSDSLIVVTTFVIESLSLGEATIDNLLFQVNERIQKKIEIEKLMLCLDFLFLIDKIEVDDATGKIKLK